MNFGIILLSLALAINIQLGQSIEITISQLYSIGKVLTSDQNVVSKFGQVIDLRNFYPLYSKFKVDEFLNCAARQLNNLTIIESCWVSYPQMGDFLNQASLDNFVLYLNKSPANVFNELKSSVPFNQFLAEKDVLNASNCLFSQLINSMTPMLCMVNYPQLVGFMNVITEQNISAFSTHFLGFLIDNFNYWLSGPESRSSLMEIPSLDFMSACLAAPNVECIKNTGLREYFSSDKIEKLAELVNLSEKSLQSAGMSVPDGIFDSLRATLNSLDETNTEINTETIIGNKSNLYYPSLTVLIVCLGFLNFF